MESGVPNQARSVTKPIVHTVSSIEEKLVIEHTVGKFSEMLFFSHAFEITRTQYPLTTRIKFSFDLTAGDCPFTHSVCLHPGNGN